MKHRNCTRDCPQYSVVLKINVETPEGFAAKQTKSEGLSFVPEVTVETPKLLCILDPTRRVKSYEDTIDAASWVTVAGLSPEVVEDVLECEGLRGYVLPIRGEKDAIRIYDWVSVRNSFF
jgi:hypothetical protein